MIQTDPAVVQQLHHLVTTQTIATVALAIVALSALGVAVAAVLAIRKAMGLIDRTSGQLAPKLDPLLASANRIAADAETIASTVKTRVDDVLGTVEDLSGRLKSGAQAVEERVKQFGTVVDVVQSEAEDLLLDAASTARGVHTAARMLRGGKPQDLPPDAPDYDVEDDVITD